MIYAYQVQICTFGYNTGNTGNTPQTLNNKAKYPKVVKDCFFQGFIAYTRRTFGYTDFMTHINKAYIMS